MNDYVDINLPDPDDVTSYDSTDSDNDFVLCEKEIATPSSGGSELRPYSLFTDGYVAIPCPKTVIVCDDIIVDSSDAPSPSHPPAPALSPALSPAEASAYSALVLMLCSAGVVPTSDHKELAHKLLGESVPNESVLRRCLRKDTDFFWETLSSIGMKPGQRSCLARYLEQTHTGAAQAVADPEAVALSNIKSLCASAPTTDSTYVKTYLDGVYVGEMQDGMRHGRGKFTFVDGHVFEGGWKNDKKHGRGGFRSCTGGEYYYEGIYGSCC